MPTAFWGRPVDLVGEDDVGEQRPLVELEPTLVIENLRADDVAWHQVRCELNAVEAQAQGLRNGVHEQGLGQPRYPDEQAVSSAEDGDEHLLDHLFLPTMTLRISAVNSACFPRSASSASLSDANAMDKVTPEVALCLGAGTTGFRISPERLS